MPALDIDNTKVLQGQVERLKRIRAERDEQACQQALQALAKAAETDEGNLLELAVVATRARATVGEISSTLETVYGRYQATTQSISGVYGSAYDQDEDFQAIRRDVERFANEEGRRPRMLVVKLGHDRGAKIIATAFADLGFDVDIGPLFQTPAEAARQALENDVHIIGASSQAAGHKTLVPQLIQALRDQGAEDIVVICGGVIPQQDYGFLKDAGVAAIYGPGTNIPTAAQEVLGLVRRLRKAA